MKHAEPEHQIEDVAEVEQEGEADEAIVFPCHERAESSLADARDLVRATTEIDLKLQFGLAVKDRPSEWAHSPDRAVIRLRVACRIYCLPTSVEAA
ncbi:hypothetical protein [Lentzea sp.]|uniref:hypothetical protein n=1 Tax=Lentzea sp. TaxID=56099 RepID=UPI002BB15B2F|nr:hypothetical protein [Lentzea sp.]HUQ54803.1 hypothetical protein [Lentzea sp.]